MDFTKLKPRFRLTRQFKQEPEFHDWRGSAERAIDLVAASQTEYRMDLAIRLSRDNWNALAQQAYLRNVTK